MTQTGFLMSTRTAKYVEAMIREGDNFNFGEWLKGAREEEAEAKQVPTEIAPRDVVAVRTDNPINKSGMRNARTSLGSALISKPGLNPRALRRRHQEAQSQTPNARLRRWLEKIHRAWGGFQSKSCSRRGLRLFGSGLRNCHALQGTTTDQRLLRHAFRFANRPFEENADFFYGSYSGARVKVISTTRLSANTHERCVMRLGARSPICG